MTSFKQMFLRGKYLGIIRDNSFRKDYNFLVGYVRKGFLTNWFLFHFWKNFSVADQKFTHILISKNINHHQCSFLFTVSSIFTKNNVSSRGKSLLGLWVTTFLPNRQPPLIFVRLISNFLCMCHKSMASAHVILK